MDTSLIKMCDMTVCVYNRDNQCHTPGITVGPHAECLTFSHNEAGIKGGYEDVKGGVGACIASECVFNKQLECSAQNIQVGGHSRHPDCTTFRSE